MKVDNKENAKSDCSEKLQENVKEPFDGELTDDDAQAAVGGKFPIFSGLDEKDSVKKPI